MRFRCLLFILYSMDNKETLNVLDQPGALVLAEKIKQLEAAVPMSISIIDGDDFYEGSDTLPEGFHIPGGNSMVLIKLGMLYVPVVNISISSHISYFSYYIRDCYYTISINHDTKTYTKSYENLVKVGGSKRDDGQTYGVKNGYLEIIAGVGEAVIVKTQANAASLALMSLKQGRLVINAIEEEKREETIAEMQELLGEELFNELAAQSVATMDIKVEKSIEQQIAEAKEAYYAEKAKQAELGIVKDKMI